jgi:hypothetical protein
MSNRTLRVAIDCRSLQDRPLGGVGRAVAGILPHLCERAEVDVLADARMEPPTGLPEAARIHALRAPLSRRGAAWLQLSVPRWLRSYSGIFHCPFYGLPYRQPVPMLVTIHDLTFEFAGDWYSAEKTIAFRLQARWAARSAREILVHSEHVRDDVLARYGRYGVTAERIRIARLPAEPFFRPSAAGDEQLLARLGVSGSYVVALGGTRRRQLGVAVGAWQRALALVGAAPEEMPLIVVGTEHPPVRAGVRYLGALSDPAWAAVLAGAVAFCYATEYEGYGMPALEALSERQRSPGGPRRRR